MSSDAEQAKALEARFEKLTPFGPFYGRAGARISASEASGLRFWLTTFAEHGVFISGNLPCDRQDLIAEAKRFTDFFENLLGRSGPQRFETGAPEAVQGAQAMLVFVERIMDMEVAGDLISGLAPSVFLHMSKETRRFISIATQPEKCIEPLWTTPQRTPLVNLLDAEQFWLMDGAEHSQMLQQVVDPLQIRYMEEARLWEALERHLAVEGDGLKRMAEAMPPKMPSAARFTRIAVGAIVGNRDFAWDTFALRDAGELLGSSPALLPYHMAREAEHGRLVIEALSGGCL